MLASRLVLGGRYELAERIGAGGFSEVWRATDLVLARPVAVKLPYPGFTQDDEALARFRAEARNAGRLEPRERGPGLRLRRAGPARTRRSWSWS